MFGIAIVTPSVLRTVSSPEEMAVFGQGAFGEMPITLLAQDGWRDCQLGNCSTNPRVRSRSGSDGVGLPLAGDAFESMHAPVGESDA